MLKNKGKRGPPSSKKKMNENEKNGSEALFCVEERDRPPRGDISDNRLFLDPPLGDPGGLYLFILLLTSCALCILI